MTSAIEHADVERFRAVVARRLGLHFDDAKLGFLAEVLCQGLEGERNGPCSAYLGRLERAAAAAEWQVLARTLTVPETYFFRHNEQFRAFAEVVLPERIRAVNGTRRIEILSAGCASGEEPYSLGILMQETLADPRQASILAVDLNGEMLRKAAAGRFSPWALRGTPPDLHSKWFRTQGRELILDEGIRSSVTFALRNLAEEDAELWRAEAYDAILCRNVLMYFTPEQAQTLVARMARALVPGGYLFLGHAETLRGLSQEFHLRHTHETFYYQRRERGEAHVPPPGATGKATAMPLLAQGIEAGDSWVEAIRHASERIEALAEPSRTRAAGGAALPAGPRVELAAVLELVQRERYTEALEVVRALPGESGGDAGVLLLRAVLLAHGGQLEEAQDACRRLLEVDELNAGAHYVIALCREGSGDHPGAVEHDRTAIYLDPRFAMPRLHLGLLARRTGDLETARTALRGALALLEREDESRLLLFGGGFGREPLLSLCRGALAACGGEA